MGQGLSRPPSRRSIWIIPGGASPSSQAAPFRGKIKKAIIGNPDEASFKRAKDHEFDIDMDEAGIVSRVVQGDNTKYQPYIDAQNRATKSSWDVMKRLTPMAEKTKVATALENVWNNRKGRRGAIRAGLFVFVDPS